MNDAKMHSRAASEQLLLLSNAISSVYNEKQRCNTQPRAERLFNNIWPAWEHGIYFLAQTLLSRPRVYTWSIKCCGGGVFKKRHSR
jgi:hypothetical protein